MPTIRMDKLELVEKVRDFQKKMKTFCVKEGRNRIEKKIWTQKDLVLIDFIEVAKITQN